MSLITFFTPKYTLIDKTTDNVTPIEIDGDNTGSLLPYRSSCKANEKIGKSGLPNANLVLRAPDGLFITKGPILTDENAKTKYLIDVQFFQPSDIGEQDEDNEGLVGRLFRFEISDATEQKGSKGLHVSLSLTNYDIRFEETQDAQRLELTTPKQAFIQRVTNAAEQRIDGGPIFVILDIGATAIDLPDDDRLKQDWIQSKPTPIRLLLDDIIDKVSKPEAIGTLNRDYFWFTVASPTSTNQFTVTAKQFGKIDSGVILKEDDIDSDVTVEKTKQSEINNRKFKNLLIARAQPGVHTFPMEFIRLASDMEHAKIAALWAVGIDYLKGDYVKDGNDRFKANSNNTSVAGNKPSIDSTTWKNLTTSTEGSPWTLDEQSWKGCMAGHDNPPSGFVGFFNDMNIVRANYDRIDEFNEFEKVSVKDIEDFLTGPGDIPAAELQEGRRWLVNNGVGTAWEGHNAQIAQRHNNDWEFSVDPVEDDIVHNLKTAQALVFDGNIWQVAWNLSTTSDKSSTFHPVSELNLVENRLKLDKAVEFVFDWNVFTASDIVQLIVNAFNLSTPTGVLFKLFGDSIAGIATKISDEFLRLTGTDTQEYIDTFGIGDTKNKAGRWCGFNIKLPFPRNAIDENNPVGKFIKKAVVDFENLHETMDEALSGWNHGLDTENLGGFRGIEFWVNNIFQNKAGTPIDGKANIPYILWFRDLFDRIVWKEVKIPAHNEWQKIKTQIGPNSDMQIFDSRVQELFTLYGFTFPDNFFIKERELTGVKFDWRRVREMGFFLRESYDDNFFYKGAQSSFLDSFVEHSTQILKNLAIYTGGLIDVEKVVVDKVRLQIDDIHFLKDAYVLSSEEAVSDLRSEVITLPRQFDYINIRGILDKLLSRRQFHPEHHIIDCRGNVLLRAGQFFTVDDSTTTEPEQLTPINVEHIDDGNGYNCQITAMRKYEVPQ